MPEERCPICGNKESAFTRCCCCDRAVCWGCADDTADGEEVICEECADDSAETEAHAEADDA